MFQQDGDHSPVSNPVGSFGSLYIPFGRFGEDSDEERVIQEILES